MEYEFYLLLGDDIEAFMQTNFGQYLYKLDLFAPPTIVQSTTFVYEYDILLIPKGLQWGQDLRIVWANTKLLLNNS